MVWGGKFILEFLVTVPQLVTFPLLLFNALSASILATTNRVSFEGSRVAFTIIATIVIRAAFPPAAEQGSSGCGVDPATWWDALRRKIAEVKDDMIPTNIDLISNIIEGASGGVHTVRVLESHRAEKMDDQYLERRQRNHGTALEQKLIATLVVQSSHLLAADFKHG
jgi:hypothetical protein